ncbi:MAG: hypothetical protein J7M24_07970 [Candidatus Latescibacteria bacterium]|nr:hypothetical protein [Candidatus Latescibacterota bacterium]
MKIQRVQTGAGGSRNIEDRKTNGAAQSRKSARTDSVSITGENPLTVEPGAVRLDIGADYPPRFDRVDAARARVESDAYDGELRNDVAGKVAESSAVKDIVAEVAMNVMKRSGARDDKVESVRRQVEQGYYDNPDVMRRVAENLIDALGLTSLFG